MTRPVSYEDLNPVSFLERSAMVYPDKPALIYNERTFTYREYQARTKRLAAALQKAGVGKGDRVAFMAPNIPAMSRAPSDRCGWARFLLLSTSGLLRARSPIS